MEENRTEVATPVPPEMSKLQMLIKETSIQMNDVLVQAGLELGVIHQIRMNPELKQEEIYHDIILKPVRK
jgi:hypothetical protein